MNHKSVYRSSNPAGSLHGPDIESDHEERVPRVVLCRLRKLDRESVARLLARVAETRPQVVVAALNDSTRTH
jgi:hypothetical protein